MSKVADKIADGKAGLLAGTQDQTVYANKQTITENYTVPVDTNVLSVGRITINSGVVVTVPSGSRWVIV